jgi:FhuF 2Fe-2S C-terminal domain
MGDERLKALARFGPYFQVTQLDDTDHNGPSRAEWLPLTALVEEPGLLAGRIAAVRRALAGPMPATPPRAVPMQVAVSVTQLGLAARLVAVALAATADGVSAPPAARLVFQDRLGGPYPLGLFTAAEARSSSPGTWPDTMCDLAWRITERSIDVYGLSPRVAWGNVASALASAVRMITDVDGATGARAERLAERAFATAELQNTGYVEESGRFRRHSCCLIYRLATDPMLCGDCVLAGRKPRS